MSKLSWNGKRGIVGKELTNISFFPQNVFKRPISLGWLYDYMNFTVLSLCDKLVSINHDRNTIDTIWPEHKSHFI